MTQVEAILTYFFYGARAGLEFVVLIAPGRRASVSPTKSGS